MKLFTNLIVAVILLSGIASAEPLTLTPAPAFTIFKPTPAPKFQIWQPRVCTGPNCPDPFAPVVVQEWRPGPCGSSAQTSGIVTQSSGEVLNVVDTSEEVEDVVVRKKFRIVKYEVCEGPECVSQDLPGGIVRGVSPVSNVYYGTPVTSFRQVNNGNCGCGPGCRCMFSNVSFQPTTVSWQGQPVMVRQRMCAPVSGVNFPTPVRNFLYRRPMRTRVRCFFGGCR